MDEYDERVKVLLRELRYQSSRPGVGFRKLAEHHIAAFAPVIAAALREQGKQIAKLKELLALSFAHMDECNPGSYLAIDLRAEIERTKANRDYWWNAAIEAQTHRDGANLRVDLRDTEIAQLKAENERLEAAYEVVKQDCWNLTEKVIPNLHAEIEQLKAQLALPEPDRGKTHYVGCWQARGHHSCAIAEVDRLMRELTVIGDMAVTDWNDPVVGVVNRAIGLQTPTSYVDWRKAELAQHGALRVENEQLKAELSNRCDECGARTYSGPPDCPTCGAPNCCQQCCMIAHLKAQLAAAEKRGMERAIEAAANAIYPGFGDYFVPLHEPPKTVRQIVIDSIRAEIAKMEGKL